MLDSHTSSCIPALTTNIAVALQVKTSPRGYAIQGRNALTLLLSKMPHSEQNALTVSSCGAYPRSMDRALAIKNLFAVLNSSGSTESVLSQHMGRCYFLLCQPGADLSDEGQSLLHGLNAAVFELQKH